MEPTRAGQTAGVYGRPAVVRKRGSLLPVGVHEGYDRHTHFSGRSWFRMQKIEIGSLGSKDPPYRNISRPDLFDRSLVHLPVRDIIRPRTD